MNNSSTLSSSKIKNSSGDKMFNFITYLILTIVTLVILYPLYFVIIASFSDPTLVNSGQVTFLPRDITFSGYNRIFGYQTVWTGYLMTLYYTVVGTLFNLFLTLPAAYVMTRKNFFAVNFFVKIFMITMFFNGGLIPTYLLVDSIGLYNTPITLVVLGGISVYNVIIVKTSLRNTVPEEIFEAASIDGCDHFRYFLGFVIPLSKSIIAVVTLYYAVGHWNNYMTALIYTNDAELFPLQLILRNILIEGEMLAENIETAEEALIRQQEAELIKYGLIVVSSLPLLAVYPFLQKYFTRGIMIGSMKG